MRSFQPAYFAVMVFETTLNVLLTFLPRVVAAEITATDISDAIKPYSMAVAPESFRINRATNRPKFSGCVRRPIPITLVFAISVASLRAKIISTGEV